jgi:uncharacterized coiled-coil protein SlyX
MSGERTIQEIIRDLIDLVKRHPHQSKALEILTIQLIEQRLAATQQKIERLKALVEEAGPYKALSLDWDKFTKILWEPVSPNVPQ